MLNIKDRVASNKILIVIPTYNNAGTLSYVINQVKEYSNDILIVNDGSTDNTQELIEKEDVKCISYTPNRGKGFAVRQAISYAKENGYDYILTLDSDGQHYASDIVNFVDKIEEEPNQLIIGSRNLAAENMPSKNTFANKFSNFWYRVETGQQLSDTQSGFRLYPVNNLVNMRFFSNRYEFEVEVIVRAAWKGVKVCNIPIKVYYPPEDERVSHFKPLKDFTRISILNTLLVTIALVYYYPWKFIRSLTKENIRNFIKDNITESKESNLKISAAFGLGIFFGIAPVWGYQMILAAFTAHLLKLNKVLTLISSNISIPPMIPFLLYGSFWTGGLILGSQKKISLESITIENVYSDLFQYLCGAVVFALACGIAIFLISFILLTIFRGRVKIKTNG